MATQKVELVNSAAVDITTALSLSVDSTYTIQALGDVVLFTEQAAAPDIATVARHRLTPKDESSGSYKAVSGESLYAWAEFGKAVLSVTESP